MKRLYRLVQFMPSPVSGARVPIAAILREGHRIRVARAPHLPDANCLGGVPTWSAMQMIVDQVCRAEHFDVLPRSVGPQATLGEPVEIPSSIEDPLDWIGEFVLPQRPGVGGDQIDIQTPAGPHRDSIGYKFLSQWKVARWVRKQFRPDFPAKLEMISHYVRGGKRLLLMEPIVTSRPQFEDDLQVVNMRFAAWKFYRKEIESKGRPEFIAYILADGRPDRIADATSAMRGVADRVVNVEDRSQREIFVNEIASVGRTGAPELGDDEN